jgi:hypothetical protein
MAAAPGCADAGPSAAELLLEVDRRWISTNRTLLAWLETLRPALGGATDTAGSIRTRIEALFPLMDELCRATCPWCPEPCCIVTRVWFDFRDLLFFHLIAAPIPPGPVCRESKTPCRYLSAHGCRLPRLLRPWACSQYFCATQRRLLAKTKGKARVMALDAEITEIALMRFAMEEAVQETLKH